MKKWSGQNRTGRTGGAGPGTLTVNNSLILPNCTELAMCNVLADMNMKGKIDKLSIVHKALGMLLKSERVA